MTVKEEKAINDLHLLLGRIDNMIPEIDELVKVLPVSIKEDFEDRYADLVDAFGDCNGMIDPDMDYDD